MSVSENNFNQLKARVANLEQKTTDIHTTVNAINESVGTIQSNNAKILEFLDKNKDGKLNSTDSVGILRDALTATQENFKETVTVLQSNNNTQQENTQKRHFLDKIVTGAIMLVSFLSWVLAGSLSLK